MIQTYHKQNKFQKKISDLVCFFKPDQEKVSELRGCGIEVYRPKIKRWRATLFITGLIPTLFTPFTTTPYVAIAGKWALK